MLKGMVHSSGPGTGAHTKSELDDLRGGDAPQPTDPTGPKTVATKSGVMPQPAAAASGVRPKPAAGPAGGIRAPLRATGRPSAGPGAPPGAQPAQQPPGQEGEGGRPKIQRGFDFR